MTSDTTTTRRARSESGRDPSFPRPTVVCLSFWFCCGAACVVAMHTRDRAHHTPPHTARASSSPASCRRETTTSTPATRDAQCAALWFICWWSFVCFFWFCCGAACVVAVHTRDRTPHTTHHHTPRARVVLTCVMPTRGHHHHPSNPRRAMRRPLIYLLVACRWASPGGAWRRGGVAKEPAIPSGEAPSPPLPAVTPSPSAGIQDSPLHFGLRSCACQFACLGLGQLACAFTKNLHMAVFGAKSRKKVTCLVPPNQQPLSVVL